MLWDLGRMQAAFGPAAVFGVFGTSFQTDARTDPVVSSSSTYLEYLKLTTTVLPAGSYFFIGSASLTVSNSNTDAAIRLVLDDNPPANPNVYQQPGVSGGRIVLTGYKILTVPVGGPFVTHAIDIEFARLSGAGTATMDDAIISLWRIN